MTLLIKRGTAILLVAKQKQLLLHSSENLRELGAEGRRAGRQLLPLVLLFFGEGDKRCAVLQFRILLGRKSKWAREPQRVPSL